eukprot:CFRG3798T1
MSLAEARLDLVLTPKGTAGTDLSSHQKQRYKELHTLDDQLLYADTDTQVTIADMSSSSPDQGIELDRGNVVREHCIQREQKHSRQHSPFADASPKSHEGQQFTVEQPIQHPLLESGDAYGVYAANASDMGLSSCVEGSDSSQQLCMDRKNGVRQCQEDEVHAHMPSQTRFDVKINHQLQYDQQLDPKQSSDRVLQTYNQSGSGVSEGSPVGRHDHTSMQSNSGREGASEMGDASGCVKSDWTQSKSRELYGENETSRITAHSISPQSLLPASNLNITKTHQHMNEQREDSQPRSPICDDQQSLHMQVKMESEITSSVGQPNSSQTSQDSTQPRNELKEEIPSIKYQVRHSLPMTETNKNVDRSQQQTCIRAQPLLQTGNVQEQTSNSISTQKCRTKSKSSITVEATTTAFNASNNQSKNNSLATTNDGHTDVPMKVNVVVQSPCSQNVEQAQIQKYSQAGPPTETNGQIQENTQTRSPMSKPQGNTAHKQPQHSTIAPHKRSIPQNEVPAQSHQPHECQVLQKSTIPSNDAGAPTSYISQPTQVHASKISHGPQSQYTQQTNLKRQQQLVHSKENEALTPNLVQQNMCIPQQAPVQNNISHAPVHAQDSEGTSNSTTTCSRKKDDDDKPRKSVTVVKWLMDNYEMWDNHSIPRQSVYDKYEEYSKIYNLGPCNNATFGKLIRSIFPNLKTRRLGTRGNSKYHYYGIREKDENNETAPCSSRPVNPCGLYPTFKNRQQGAITVATFDDAQSFIHAHHRHCLRVLERLTRYAFDEVKLEVTSFWSSLTPTLLNAYLIHPEAKKSARTNDTLVWHNALLTLFPSPLNMTRLSRLKCTRSFAKTALHVLMDPLECLKGTDVYVHRQSSTQYFARVLLRLTSLTHLAQAARALLYSADHVDQMLADWVRIDVSGVLWQAKEYCYCSFKTLQDLKLGFETLLKSKATLNVWVQWIERTLAQHIVGESGSPENEKSIRTFLGQWGLVGSMVIRNLTVKSAKSFGSFHLLRLLLDEYLTYLVERDNTLPEKITPLVTWAIGGESGVGVGPSANNDIVNANTSLNLNMNLNRTNETSGGVDMKVNGNGSVDMDMSIYHVGAYPHAVPDMMYSCGTERGDDGSLNQPPLNVSAVGGDVGAEGKRSINNHDGPVLLFPKPEPQLITRLHAQQLHSSNNKQIKPHPPPTQAKNGKYVQHPTARTFEQKHHRQYEQGQPRLFNMQPQSSNTSMPYTSQCHSQHGQMQGNFVVQSFAQEQLQQQIKHCQSSPTPSKQNLQAKLGQEVQQHQHSTPQHVGTKSSAEHEGASQTTIETSTILDSRTDNVHDVNDECSCFLGSAVEDGNNDIFDRNADVGSNGTQHSTSLPVDVIDDARYLDKNSNTCNITPLNNANDGLEWNKPVTKDSPAYTAKQNTTTSHINNILQTRQQNVSSDANDVTLGSGGEIPISLNDQETHQQYRNSIYKPHSHDMSQPLKRTADQLEGTDIDTHAVHRSASTALSGNDPSNANRRVGMAGRAFQPSSNITVAKRLRYNNNDSAVNS